MPKLSPGATTAEALERAKKLYFDPAFVNTIGGSKLVAALTQARKEAENGPEWQPKTLSAFSDAVKSTTSHGNVYKYGEWAEKQEEHHRIVRNMFNLAIARARDLNMYNANAKV